MSSILSGNAANVTTISAPQTATVVAISAGPGGLVRISTSSAHLFSTGDYVLTSGVVGTVEANTTDTITVLGSNTFLLNNTTFSNAYVSGGTCVDLSLTPAFQIPSDGEAGTVASILAMMQSLADRTQFIWAAARLGSVKLTAAGTYTIQAPAYATKALVALYGGGGGGGYGGYDNASASADQHFTGGSGGGGAVMNLVLVDAIGLSNYTAVVGAGGAGGVPGLIPTPGQSGVNSTLSLGATLLATGLGGQAGIAGYHAGAFKAVVFGSGMKGTGPSTVNMEFTDQTFFALAKGYTPGQGGPGITSELTPQQGNSSVQGFAGGAAGANGTRVGSGASPTYYGGGAGGGGGAGPGGVGGKGGDGGNGNAAGVGGSGTASSVFPGPGGGGGGGGGGGNGSVAGINGGQGQAGGDGAMQILWLRG